MWHCGAEIGVYPEKVPPIILRSLCTSRTKPATGKMIGFFAMYIGRLELMPIFLLFTPELWRK
jgi:hypothetical protein